MFWFPKQFAGHCRVNMQEGNSGRAFCGAVLGHLENKGISGGSMNELQNLNTQKSSGGTRK